MLALAHQAGEALARDELFELGVNPFEARRLLLLSDTADAHASELARSLNVPASTVTRALRRLERYGLVVLRKGWFGDARVLLPRLTESGVRTRRAVEGFEAAVDRALFGHLRADHLGVLLNALLEVVYGPRQRPSGGRGSADVSTETASPTRIVP